MKKSEIFAMFFCGALVLFLSVFYFKSGGGELETKENYAKIVAMVERQGKDLGELTTEEIEAFYHLRDISTAEETAEKERKNAIVDEYGKKTIRELFLLESSPYEEVGVGELVSLPRKETKPFISTHGWIAAINLDGKMLFVEGSPGDGMSIGDKVLLCKQEQERVVSGKKLFIPRLFITPVVAANEKIASNSN